MPLLIAPALADGPSQTVLFLLVVIGHAVIRRCGRCKDDARFELKMVQGPKSWNSCNAKLPDVTFCFVAQHGPSSVALATPRNSLTGLDDGRSDMEARGGRIGV